MNILDRVSRTAKRPVVHLKFACSLDGALDDAQEQRKTFSTEADTAEVQKLRAQADAILIGAETLRKDDPLLNLKSADLIGGRKAQGRSSEPARIILTKSGNIPAGSKLFQEGSGERIIFTTSTGIEPLRALNLQAEIIEAPGETIEVAWMLKELHRRGVKILLVEGGASLLASFYSAGLFDFIRTAISPEFISGENVPRWQATHSSLQLLRARNVGGMTTLEYSKKDS